jgi:hypothetical protein
MNHGGLIAEMDQTDETAVAAPQHAVTPGSRHPVDPAGADVDLDDRQRLPTCP